MNFEILFPFGLWVFEPDWLLNHSQELRSIHGPAMAYGRTPPVRPIFYALLGTTTEHGAARSPASAGLGRVHFGSEGGAPNGNMVTCLGGGLKALELQLHST